MSVYFKAKNIQTGNLIDLLYPQDSLEDIELMSSSDILACLRCGRTVTVQHLQKNIWGFTHKDEGTICTTTPDELEAIETDYLNPDNNEDI